MKDKILNFIATAIMMFFAIPKLIGVVQSKIGFEQFEEVLGLNADILRVFTGTTEIIIALLLIFISIKENKKLTFLTYTILLSTMVVALIMELFVRPEPKMLLVGIAILLVILSVYRLNQLKTLFRRMFFNSKTKF